MKRKLFKPFDAVILVILLAAVLFLRIRAKDKERTAVITVDGKEVYSADLNTAEDAVFTLKEVPDVTVEIKNGTIAFINAKCRDKICEKSGFLKNTGDTAACLPNKTVITVKGNTENSDGVSY